MQNFNIIFTDNGWYLPGGLIVLLWISMIPVVAILRSRQSRRNRAAWLFTLIWFVFFGWALGYDAKASFGSFTRLERQGSGIRFYYYFGKPREYQWRDVQKIVQEGGRGGTEFRFFMRDGTQLVSYSTSNQNTIAAVLSLRSQIKDLPPHATAPR